MRSIPRTTPVRPSIPPTRPIDRDVPPTRPIRSVTEPTQPIKLSDVPPTEPIQRSEPTPVTDAALRISDLYPPLLTALPFLFIAAILVLFKPFMLDAQATAAALARDHQWTSGTVRAARTIERTVIVKYSFVEPGGRTIYGEQKLRRLPPGRQRPASGQSISVAYSPLDPRHNAINVQERAIDVIVYNEQPAIWLFFLAFASAVMVHKARRTHDRHRLAHSPC